MDRCHQCDLLSCQTRKIRLGRAVGLLIHESTSDIKIYQDQCLTVLVHFVQEWKAFHYWFHVC